MTTVLVTGATGNQGGAVVDHLPASDADVEVPGLTRDAAARASWRVEPSLSAVQVLALTAAGAAMVASQANLVVAHPGVLALVAVLVVVFYAVTLAVTLALGRALSFDDAETACLVCTTRSRNSPTALAIAAATSPGRPLAALALVEVPLVEVPPLSVVSRIPMAARDRGLAGATPA